MKRHPVHTLLCLTPLALTLASCEKVEVIDEAPADGETTKDAKAMVIKDGVAVLYTK